MIIRMGCLVTVVFTTTTESDNWGRSERSAPPHFMHEKSVGKTKAIFFCSLHKLFKCKFCWCFANLVLKHKSNLIVCMHLLSCWNNNDKNVLMDFMQQKVCNFWFKIGYFSLKRMCKKATFVAIQKQWKNVNSEKITV